MKVTFKLIALALICSTLFSCEPAEIAPEQIQFDHIHTQTAEPNTSNTNTQETKSTLPHLR
jgi:hypothetical protein